MLQLLPITLHYVLIIIIITVINISFYLKSKYKIIYT